MEQISYTVYPKHIPTLIEWMIEFKVGIMAPKPNDRALTIMNQWNSTDFSEIVSKLKLPTMY